MTIAEWLATASEQLQQHSDSARLDAELLLSECLNKPRAYLYTWPERVVPAQQAQRFAALLARREQGEPVAHLLGRREFWSLELKVSADTLIPRPDTEILVDTCLQCCAADMLLAVDLGTGSGAIALALASERPNWQIVAVDRSFAALQIARDNAEQLGAAQLSLLQGDWAAALAPGCWDLVVSNPPYIAPDDPHLNSAELRFEPRSALVANAQGLADLHRIIDQASSLLKPGGLLVLEHGYEQAAAVRQELHQHGFVRVETRRDVAGQERISLGFAPGGNHE